MEKNQTVTQTANGAEPIKAPELNVQIPPLEDFLKAGAHFGHKTSRWNPKMDRYIYGTRNGVHIIDLIKTMKLLKKALEAIREASDKGGILIIGTKGQAAGLVQKVAEQYGAFYINLRWPGGLFTNFETVKASVDKLIKMEETVANGAPGFVKKEQILMEREVNKLNKLYSGIKFMDKLPTMIVVIDAKIEKNAIRESNLTNVPIVGLVDTNGDPTILKYPIPANDDSIKSVELFVNLFGQVLGEGKKSQGLVALRKNHEAKIETLKKQYADEVARKKAMEDEERERMKRLRAGLEDTKKSVARASKDSSTEKVVRVVRAEEKSGVDSGIDSLGLTARVVKLLKAGGYTTVAELAGKSKGDLMNVKGIGEKTAEDILSALKGRS